jgi:hypothetical protein
MCKRNASHAAAIAVGIAAGTDDKMLGHTAILEANAQRTTSLRNTTAREALNSEYFRERASNLELGISKFDFGRQSESNFGFLAETFL